jgi:hypothetical protein
VTRYVGDVPKPAVLDLHEIDEIAADVAARHRPAVELVVADRLPDLGHEHAMDVTCDGNLGLQTQVAGSGYVDEAEKRAVAENDRGNAAHAIDEKTSLRRRRQHRKQTRHDGDVDSVHGHQRDEPRRMHRHRHDGIAHAQQARHDHGHDEQHPRLPAADHDVDHEAEHRAGAEDGDPEPDELTPRERAQQLGQRSHPPGPGEAVNGRCHAAMVRGIRSRTVPNGYQMRCLRKRSSSC